MFHLKMLEVQIKYYGMVLVGSILFLAKRLSRLALVILPTGSQSLFSVTFQYGNLSLS